MLRKLPPIFKNFHFITGICFLLWMTFMDSNDLISRYKMAAKLRSLEHEKQYYIEKMREVETDRRQLLTDQEMLEKFAREKYLMKKETEDVFIIQEE